jgi:hypothetical protein
VTNTQILSYQLHKELRLDTNKLGPANHRSRQIVQVFATEFHLIAANLPIVFVKDPDTGEFKSVALFSLQKDKNVMMSGDKWSIFHLPINVRNYPFVLKAITPDDSEYAIGADLSLDAFCKQKGELLFKQDGQPSAILQKVKNYLFDSLEAEQQTKKFIQVLLDNDLLTEQSLNVDFKPVGKCSIDGLYVVDEKKLRELNKDIVGMWIENGYLRAIFAHLQSQLQVANLIKNHQRTGD